MESAATLVLLLLCVAVDVHSQPDGPALSNIHVSIGNISLANHSYVNLRFVGEDDATALHCHTDLESCCTVNDDYLGNWYPPREAEPLPLNTNGEAVLSQRRQRKAVALYHKSTSGFNQDDNGVYRCSFSATPHHNNYDFQPPGEFMYVGLYNNGGDISFLGGMFFEADSDLNGDTPQFTLVSHSIGGPATIVTWTRNSEVISAGVTTELYDYVTAHYVHRLTITGRRGGLYECTVSNQKPSIASVTYYMQVASAPTGLMIYQFDHANMRATWNPPAPLGDTTGYKIHYIADGSSGSVYIDNVKKQSHTFPVSNFVTGVRYTVSLVGLSDHFFSEATYTTIELTSGVLLAYNRGHTVGTTNIRLGWTLFGDKTASNYTISYNVRNPRCVTDSGFEVDLDGGSTTYRMHSLLPFTEYAITLTAKLTDGTTAVAHSTERTAIYGAQMIDNLKISSVTNTSVSLKWDNLGCKDPEGLISEFKVVYEVWPDSTAAQTTFVSGRNVTEITIEELIPGTQYKIGVAAVYLYTSSLSKFSYVYKTTAIPLSVSVVLTNQTAISLTWNSTFKDSHSYDVIWQRIVSEDCSYPNTIHTVSLSDTSTSYTITGLDENSIYNITVTITSDATILASESVLGTTKEAGPSSPPRYDRVDDNQHTLYSSNIVSHRPNVYNVTTHGIMLWWSPPPCRHHNGELTGYSVRYGAVNSDDMLTMNVSGVQTTMTSVFGLESATFYRIQVAAFNKIGTGPFSHFLYFRTPVSQPVVSITATTATSITVSWTSAGPDIGRYEVMWERDTSGECPDEDRGSVAITDGPTQYTIAGLEEASTYTITVAVGEVRGYGVGSTRESEPSAAPQNIAMTGMTTDSISVEWEEVDCIYHNGIITHYSVRYKYIDRNSSMETVMTTTTPKTRFTLTNLQPSTMYEIQVAAVNNMGTGTYSIPMRMNQEIPTVSGSGKGSEGMLLIGIGGLIGGIAVAVLVTVVICMFLWKYRTNKKAQKATNKDNVSRTGSELQRDTLAYTLSSLEKSMQEQIKQDYADCTIYDEVDNVLESLGEGQRYVGHSNIDNPMYSQVVSQPQDKFEMSDDDSFESHDDSNPYENV